MGVKSKAAGAILLLLLFIGSLWLHGGLDNHWDSCLKAYKQAHKFPQVSNRRAATGPVGAGLACPSQTFQVSQLLTHLLHAPVGSADVLMQPYLSSWDELVKFMESLGPMVGLISQEIKTKTSIIRHLALYANGSPDAELSPDLRPLTAEEASQRSSEYHSVHSMIVGELKRGLVDFHQHTDSGCRTLLRLHRALLWLKLFLQKLVEMPVAGHLRSPSELCREAYQNTLANHHSWLVRRAAELAFIAMPERAFFFRLVCVQSQEELSTVLGRVVQAIGVVYDRTQTLLEKYGMLDLP